MQKLQESVFSIVKTTSLSPAVFSFLQPTEDFSDKTLPLGGILRDTKYGWLALGPKFCVVDLRSGLKVAARTFGYGLSNSINVTSVVELPTPLTDNSQQLIISLDLNGSEGLICVFHVNGSQLLRSIKTDVVVTELAVCDEAPSGPLMCFDGLVMAGTCRGEIFVFDLNRACLIQALKDISQGNEHLVRNEENSTNLVYLKAVHKIESQRDFAIENDDHLGLLLNEDSFLEGQYIFRNPDGTVRMKAKQNHIRVTVLQYIPQLGSLAVGFNFGAFQIWNMLNLELEFTSQVNVECLPVTHFGFQEPCDDPRAFCYLWVVFSVIDRFEEEEFPLAVMYSLTYQGKRMLSETKSLYQEFSTATIRFQVELCAIEDVSQFIGGRCISCHPYSIRSTLGEEGEDTMLNLCQLVWECWGETPACIQYGMLLFDLDQWYKDQMPATYQLENNAFMSTARCPEISRGSCLTLDLRLDPTSLSPYSHATRLEEHFYPNSLQYNCVCLNTSEASTIHTVGVQRQILRSMCAAGPSCLLSPARLHAACRGAGLAPLYCDVHASYAPTPEEQRHFLLSVALEARLSRFLKRCAHDWATGTHSGVGCTLTFLVDWCWKRAIELKENAKELTAPLFTSATLPDRNVVRCLEHCVQQLTALTGLLDAVLTKCCNLVVPDALSEMEEKYKGIGTVSLYFQVVQWFVRVGLLPERLHSFDALPYPAPQLYATYNKRRTKLHRLQDKPDGESANKSCPLLYIDQLIEYEFGGERVHQMWVKGGSECGGLYPPPSLYALLRLYLLPDIALEHKHSLLLYLLLDYSMLYDEIRYEAVIRRLMQFPTMFGLSNTAIKATQAFWHLDHRDFDFALDQLQCLTGNTLSDWQHHVVLSSLLAQKKTQAALQYLHVKKPPPIQNMKDGEDNVNEHYKLEDWQSCCNLYLARGLVFEALDVIRMCVRNADSLADKAHLLNFFYKGCRNTGQLSKVLQVTLLPLEEEMFVKYLQDCNESQTSELLVMYYLQQARYLEAEQYNSKLKSKGRPKDMTTSAESILDVLDRENARDALVEVVCASLPTIATSVARCALTDFETHIVKPKPMSVYVQALSPKNTFTYKSSFIQDTIENASETWLNRPKLKKGLKRALNVQDTPFICTPKTYKSKSLLSSEQRGSEATPAKRMKLDFTGTPRTPKMPCSLKVSDVLSQQMASLLDMPEVQTPQKYYDRSGAETPQSILKNRRLDERDVPSPADSRYLCDSDEDELETASNHTHYSDSTNKHLRFTIPTASEGGSTPSPVAIPVKRETEDERTEDERGGHSDSYKSTMSEIHPMESPPKKFAAEGVKSKKTYKDIVRARRSLSISANSSLSDDPNTSIESIADIPVTLFNPRYSGGMKRPSFTDNKETEREISQEKEEKEISQTKEEREMEVDEEKIECPRDTYVPKTPQGRRSIRSGVRESAPLRSHSTTPERTDSPVVTPLRTARATRTRSRSRTPEISPRSSPLAPILEQPKQEVESEPHLKATTLSVPRQLRSRSRTPERQDKPYKESPRLEAIKESPTKVTDSPPASPKRSMRSRSRTPEVTNVPDQPVASSRSLRSRSRTPDLETVEQKTVSSPRSLRSRSRTPEVEITSEPVAVSPRALRSCRAKTPEKLMSPKKEHVSRSKKSLTRIVLEANTFAKTKQQLEMLESEAAEEISDSAIECTPMKSSKEISTLMDITFSPITNKSILQSSTESLLSVSTEKDIKHAEDSNTITKPLPSFTINETRIEKSVLHSYESSVADNSDTHEEKTEPVVVIHSDVKLSAFTTIHEDFGKSVLQSAESSIESSNQTNVQNEEIAVEIPKLSFKLNETNIERSVLGSCESSIAQDSISKSLITFKDDSNIMTSDSEMEIKDTWKSQMETQARVIQKEKESIVEIVREINEIEGEMSDDCHIDTDSEDGQDDENEDDDDENEEDDDEDEIDNDDEENDSEDSNENDEDGESSEEEEPQIDNDVISIDDSDDSSNTNTLQIDEPSSSDVTSDPIVVREIELIEHESYTQVKEIPKVYELIAESHTDYDKIIEIPMKGGKVEEIISKVQMDMASDHVGETAMEFESVVEENTVNLLDEAQMSILTDDNSALASEQSINLIYSDEQKGEEDKAKSYDTAMKIDQPNVPHDIHSIENKKPAVAKDLDISNAGDDVLKVEMVEENIEENLEKITESGAKEIKEVAESEKPSIRKRTKSTSDTTKEIAPKTPTRRRTQSNASIKSDVEKSPESVNEEVATPSSRRRRTPSTENRRIITRRASKELQEDVSMIEEEAPTPRRRTTRSRSKKDDDNDSVTSDTSVKSSRSKASEDAGEVRSVRKRRPSLKPELTVIPEVSSEDSRPETVETVEDIVKEYSNTRRLSRQQKKMLESLVEHPTPRTPRRRASATSRSEAEEDDVSPSAHSAIDEGSVGTDESRPSPDSTTPVKPKARTARSASETKASPKPARATRRMSVDIAAAGTASPASPARGRRASFTRACEALLTPKSRRPSTEIKSQQGSPTSEAEAPATPGTPGRRRRRASNASQK
ncbi:protein ELYS [Bicyclus anynana]|uniref:Protein ELYS n=1 Tax=Bicyclus anynana TaxID=110368 RepID=A0ABM3LS33_BICAN|nr:protein ELYS [Bicyclus anynana]